MSPFQIYNAAIRWNGCDDVRPVLIIQVRPADVFACFPIFGNCYGGSCFELNQSHVDFAATGLSKNCFIHDSHLFDLRRAAFGRLRGALTGELLTEFREFSGV